MGISKKLYIGLASICVSIGSLLALGGAVPASALTMGERRDCGFTDVIIDCGATSQSELLQKYDSNDDGRGNKDIKTIFSNYGIKRSDIAGTTSEVKRGWLNTDGVITVDGKTVATGAQSLYRVDPPGKTVSPKKIGGKTYYSGSVNGNYDKGADVFVFMKNGTFHAAIQASCGNPIPAEPEKPVKPIFACDSLEATKLDRTRYRFSASATSSTGAEIVSYTFTFGDGESETTDSDTIEHQYEDPGSYVARVSVNMKSNGKIKMVTSENCKVTIKVDSKPKQPLYRCDNLSARHITGRDRTYTYMLEYTAQGGATLDRVTYDFGDNSTETVVSGNETDVEHTYAQPGNYVTTATLFFDIEDETETTEESVTCSAKITIPKPEYCPIPGKEHLPKDSPECEESPPELPKTGLELFIGGTLGVGSVTAATYYWGMSRKNLLDTFLKR